MNEKNLQSLYNSLKRHGYEMSSFDDFKRNMADDNKRRQGYDAISKEFNLPDYDQFSKDMGFGAAEPAPQPQPQQTEAPQPTAQQQEPPKVSAPLAEGVRLPNASIQSVLGQQSTLEDMPQPKAQPQGGEFARQQVEQFNQAVNANRANMFKQPALRDEIGGIKAETYNPDAVAAMERAYTSFEPKTIEEQIADIEKRIDQRQKELYNERNKQQPVNSFVFGAGAAPSAPKVNTNEDDEELQTLIAARDQLYEAKKAKKLGDADVADNKAGNTGLWGFFKGAGRGLASSVFDLTTWDFGVSDLSNNTQLLEIAQKAERGEKLTQAEDDLLTAASINAAAQSYLSEVGGYGTSAGKITGESLPFMLEFAINPLSGSSSSIAKYGAKKFGVTALKRGIGKKLAKAGLRTAGDVAAAAGMTATTGATRVAADATQRMAGNIMPTYDEFGYVQYGGREGAEENVATAVGKAAGSAVIENYSELLGAQFAPMLNAGGKFAKDAAEKVGLKKVTEVLSDISGSNFAKGFRGFLDKTQWHGPVGEYFEEVASNILNAAFVGDMKFDASEEGVFNLENNIDTFLGVALMGGAFSAINTAGYAVEKAGNLKLQRQLKNESVRMAEMLGDKWAGIKDQIDNAEDEQLVSLLTDITYSNDYTAEQKKGIWQYAAKLKASQGANMVRLEQQIGGEFSPQINDVIDGFEAGYMAPLSEAAAIKAAYDDAVSAYEQNYEPIGDNLNDAISEAIYVGDQTRADALVDIAKKKAAFEGIKNQARDNMQDRIDNSNAHIDRLTNQGMVIQATLKEGDKPVFITSGAVVSYDDGTVDTKNSSDFLVGMTPEGEVITFGPGQLLRVDSATPADAMKYYTQQAILSEEQETINNVDNGTVNVQPGETYSLVNSQGEQIDVSIIQDNGDGTFLIDDGLAKRNVPAEQLQQMLQQSMVVNARTLREQQEAQREQQYAAAAESVAVEPVEQPTAEEATEEAVTEQQTEQPQPIIVGDEFTNAAGETGIVQSVDGDGAVITWERADGSSYTNRMTAEDIAAMQVPTQAPVEAQPEAAATPSPEELQAAEQAQTTVEQTPESVIAEMQDFEPEERQVIVNNNIQAAEQAYNDILNAKPVPGMDIAAFRQEKAEWQANVEQAKANLDFWNNVNALLNAPAAEEAVATPEETQPQPPVSATAEAIAQAEAETNTEPTEAQKEAGNYKKGHVIVDGMNITIEQPKGSVRRGTDANGKAWETVMQNTYGYIRGTQSVDGDHIDIFLSDNPETGNVYVVDQMNSDGTFDEHKVMYGFNSVEEARAAYLSNYEEGWQGLGNITEVSKEDFKKWLDSSTRKTKPFAEYASTPAPAVLDNDTEGAPQDTAEPWPTTEHMQPAWQQARKEVGMTDDYTLPNGETIEGVYVLTEAEALSPSHNPNAGFSKTEGFPVDENGNTINDRDYEFDKEAQAIVSKKAQDYDQRAVQTPVIVTGDGIVISGNDRTMSGQMAAEMGTDGKYISYITNRAAKFGFTPEQVSSFTHPRIVFVPTQPVDYNAKTFAKFNAEDKKTQNKTEQAVKLGKTISDNGMMQIAEIINTFETMSDLYANQSAVADIMNILQREGVIVDEQRAQLFDGNTLSAIGKDLLENVLVGGSLSEESVRSLNQMKDVRSRVVKAILQVLTNRTLGEYSLTGEISDAIEFLYQARKSGVKDNETTEAFARQPDLFGGKPSEIYNATVQMIANALNKSGNLFKNFLNQYNESASASASGQLDMFTGDVESKEQIINNILDVLYGKGKRTFTTEKGSTGSQRDAVGDESREPAAENESGEERVDTAEATAESEEPAEEDRELTEEEVLNSDLDEAIKTGAIAYINGNRNLAVQAAYQIAKDYVRNQSQLRTGDSQNADETFVGTEDNDVSGGESGQGGSEDTGLDRGDGSEDVSGSGTGGKDSEDGMASPSRKRSNKPVGKTEYAEGAERSGDTGGKTGSGVRSDGRNVRRGKGQADSSGVPSEDEGRTETADDLISSALGEIKDILTHPFRLPKSITDKGNVFEGSSLLVAALGVNAVKLFASTAKLGYGLVLKGITSFNKWVSGMHNSLDALFKDNTELTDEQIDEFIKSMWDYPFAYNGETHTIAEWSSLIEAENLRKLVSMSINEKRKLQKEAENTPTIVGDIDNIRESLPFLLPAQQEDVQRAETQFFHESHNDIEHANGKGYMFTNGTGTGKTYTGLGIVKRFLKQGKKRILIVTAQEKKINDWINDAKNLGIKANKLENTTSKGEGVVVTQYANIRQNLELLTEEFDLIVYDESHKIMENQTGEATTTATFHHMLSNRDVEQAILRRMYNTELWVEERNKKQEMAELGALLSMADDSPKGEVLDAIKTNGGVEGLKGKINKLDAEIKELQNKQLEAIEAAMKDPKERKAAEEAVKRTKVVFLSATPFNTPSSLDYVEGYIFTYPQSDGPTDRKKQKNRFLMNRFPSSHTRNKSGDVVRMGESAIKDPAGASREEIAFSDYLQNTLKTMSGRSLDSLYDYSREFPRLDFGEVELFNVAVEQLERGKYAPLAKYFKHLLNDYPTMTALFEAIKTAGAIERIRQHVEQGRKVVVFHRRMNAKEPLQPPFTFGLNNVMQTGDAKEKELAAKFANDFRSLILWENSINLDFPHNQIIESFATQKDREDYQKALKEWEKKAEAAMAQGKKVPNPPTLKASSVRVFNGMVPQSEREKAVNDFNDDNSGADVLVVQIQSGKEGISLHDTTGKHQRAMISLQLPQSPIEFIQAEGRIYRVGNKSNAIFEYPLLGINIELASFAAKINGRSQTSENLALGSTSRGLRDSIARAALASRKIPVTPNQGIGGKMLDDRAKQESTQYDDAITNFAEWSNTQPKDFDDMQIPDPLGYKMAEWAKLENGETVIVPNAGTGTTARYTPGNAKLIALETEGGKFAKLVTLVGGGGRVVEQSDFRDLSISHYKADAVLIKCKSGETVNPYIKEINLNATNDIYKAYRHLEPGGRIIAVVKQSEVAEIIQSFSEGSQLVPVAEIKMPKTLFNGEATSVLVIDFVPKQELREAMPAKTKIDLSANTELKDLFEALRTVDLPARTIDKNGRIRKRVERVSKQIENSPIVQAEKRFSKSGKYVLISDYGLDVRMKPYTMSIPYEDGRRYREFIIDFDKIANENMRYIQWLAQTWVYLDENVNMNDGEIRGRYYSVDEKNIDAIRDLSAQFKKCIEAALKKNETQIRNIAKGEMENKVSGDMSISQFKMAFDALNNDNADAKSLADKVFLAASKIDGLKFTVVGQMSRRTVAHYVPGRNIIELNGDVYNSLLYPDYKKANAITHELIHAVTAYMLANYQAGNTSSMTKEQIDACKDIMDVYDIISKDDFRAQLRLNSKMSDNAEYGLEDVYEMVAELSNPVFRAQLKAKKLWRQLINGIKRLLGINVTQEKDTETNAADVVENALDALMDNFNADLYQEFVSNPFKYQEAQELQREGDGAYTDAEVSMANDPISKVLGRNRFSKRKQSEFAERERERMVGRVNELAEKLNLTNVDVVTDASTLSGPQSRAKGFYNTRTGRITVVIPNHVSSIDVEQTLLHEAVAHYGLRRMFGKDFDAFLDSVYEAATPELRQRIDALVEKYGDKRTATEEYIASLAESTDFDNFDYGWWSKVKENFVKMLNKLGFNFEPGDISDNELRYLLWRSNKSLRDPGAYNIRNMAEDVAMQSTLQVGNYAPSAEIENEVADILLREDANDEQILNENIAESVNRLASSMNAKVKVVSNISELPETATKRAIEKGRNIKGWYDTATGEVVVYLPNTANEQDARQTVFHEVVGHKGLREMFGSDFNTFLQNVYSNASTAVRKRIAALASKNGWNISLATEEYLATLAEKGFDDAKERSFFQSVKDAFINLLRKAGISLGFKLTDKELRYILWRSYQMQQNKGIVGEAENVAMQMAMKVGNYAPKGDVLFRDSTAAVQIRDDYEKKVAGILKNTGLFKGAVHNISEGHFDYLRSVRIAQELIEKKSGTKIQDFENVYKNANRKSSMDNVEIREFTDNIKKPFLRHIAKMIKRKKMDGQKVTSEYVDKYLYLLHAPERNEVFARRDARKIKEEEIKKLDKQKAAGLISDADYNTAKSEAEAKELENYKNFREKDYSGLTEMFGEGKTVQELEALAKEYTDKFEQIIGQENIDTLNDWVKQISRYTLRKTYESGIISRTTMEELENMFEHYVPLRGFKDDVSSDIYKYVGSEANATDRKVIKDAKGRKSTADSPIANLLIMGTNAIVSGNKNKFIKMSLLNLAENHPTDLLTVSSMWYEKQPDGTWEPKVADIPENATAKEVAMIVEAFEEDMKLKAKAKMARRRKGKSDIPLRVLNNRQESQHAVRVLRNGDEYVVYINGNPKLAQAVNGLLNIDTTDNHIWRKIRWLNGIYAKLRTIWSPLFVIRNFIRDVQASLKTSIIKEGPKYTALFGKNLLNSLCPFGVKGARMGKFTGMYNLYMRYKKGKLDMNNPRDRYFQEFIKNGGETGITQMFTIDSYKKDIKNMVDKNMFIKTKDVATAVFKAMGNGIEFVNRGIENACRFAAYMTSRQMGKSITDSIYDAKEISVNFNRKGSGALGNRLCVTNYVFFNAAMQSLYKEVDLYRKYPAKTIAFNFGTMAIGFLFALLGINSGDDGDDDDEMPGYFDINSFTRRNNVLISMGDGQFAKVPLSYEVAVWYGMGDILATMLYDEYSMENPATEMAMQLTNMLPLDVVEGKNLMDPDRTFLEQVGKAFIPSWGVPAAESYIYQTDFLGRPINNRTDFNEHKPEWQRANKNTSQFFIGLSKAISEISGGRYYKKGNIDNVLINPGSMEHMTKSTFGGLGTFVIDASKTVEELLKEDSVKTSELPLVRPFYVDLDNDYYRNRRINDRWYFYANEYESLWYNINSILKDASIPKEEKQAEIDSYKRNGEYEKVGLFRGSKDVDGFKKISTRLDNAIREAESIGDENAVEKLYDMRAEFRRKAVNVLDSITEEHK